MIDLRLGDCFEIMKTMPANSVDSIVTDPPYELGFMGKKWDNSGIAYNVELWKECLRVLKPGGHLLAFGGTRTYHRMACAIEDAGFEIRDMVEDIFRAETRMKELFESLCFEQKKLLLDCLQGLGMIEWIYASGFPKSLNIGKKYDQLQGNKREVLSTTIRTTHKDGTSYQWAGGKDTGICKNTKGNSEWEGFGTALKPAHEPICMARKPLSEKTIVENVLKHGTGAIDIDSCRIPTSEEIKPSTMPDLRDVGRKSKEAIGIDKLSFGQVSNAERLEYNPNTQGRFPANVVCTDDALNTGEIQKSGKAMRSNSGGNTFGGENKKPPMEDLGYNDSGSKSRYFDIDCWAEKHGLLQFPKASKRERNEGCEGLEVKERIRQGLAGEHKNTFSNNSHPTVKPVHLMAWLVRLVTPPKGVCLDPFMGSGTTGVACKKLCRNFIGIELSPEYFEIAKKRIDNTQESML